MRDTETADVLLHDAQHRHGGAAFARGLMRDHKRAAEMEREAATMVREAYALDAAYCERCRAEDEEGGGLYADFWAFAAKVRAAAGEGRGDG